MQLDHELNVEGINGKHKSNISELRDDYARQISDLHADFERRMQELIAAKDAEREKLRIEMQLIIDELKRQIENEKENMGAAGKRRENELLGMLEELRREMKLKIEQISKLEASEKQLQSSVKERDETIERLRGEIADLTAQNKRLEDELFRAQQSGDDETKKLREQLKRTQDEFEAMKVKAAKDFETMRNDLAARSKQELDALRSKYEAMLEEMRINGNADKEFVANELRKRI